MPRGIEAESLSKAARQLRSEAAKLINFINNCNERIIVVGRDCYPDNKKLAVCTAVVTVGRHCGITDECSTRGARNEIHICDSNMNGSSEREVISRHYADKESDLDAKMLRYIDAKSVSGKMYCHALLSKEESGLFAEGAGSTRRRGAGGAFRRPVKREQPSKEVVNELERILQPQERCWQKLLQIFRTPLSRISNAHRCSQRTATSSLGEVYAMIHENSRNRRHSERLAYHKGILPRTARHSPTMQARI